MKIILLAAIATCCSTFRYLPERSRSSRINDFRYMPLARETKRHSNVFEDGAFRGSGQPFKQQARLRIPKHLMTDNMTWYTSTLKENNLPVCNLRNIWAADIEFRNNHSDHLNTNEQQRIFVVLGPCRRHFFSNPGGAKCRYPIPVSDEYNNLSFIGIFVLQKVHTRVDPEFLDVKASLLLNDQVYVTVPVQEFHTSGYHLCYVGWEYGNGKLLAEFHNPEIEVSVRCKQRYPDENACSETGFVHKPEIFLWLGRDYSHPLRTPIH